MQKARFGEANIHKSSLHPRENFRHPAAIDMANETTVGMLLDEQFRHRTLFEQRYTSLAGCGVDNNVDQERIPPGKSASVG
jgi:hypothetical protein